MAPVYLNSSSPSPAELKDDQKFEFLFPNYHALTSLSCPSFFNANQDQTEFEETVHDQQGKIRIKLAGSSSAQGSPSSSRRPSIDRDDDHQGRNSSTFKGENEDGKQLDDGSVAWMSSKMRVMHKMVNSSNCSTSGRRMRFTQKAHDHNSHLNPSNGRNNNTIRVCSDCNTTTTPLWRSGPRGPKSLCNACGIRQRKARKAMEEAANARGSGGAAESCSSTRIKVHNREKKSRSSHNTEQIKKQFSRSPPEEGCDQTPERLCFEDLALNLRKNSAFQKVFPRDEEQAAILLMELSCGLIHS